MRKTITFGVPPIPFSMQQDELLNEQIKIMLPVSGNVESFFIYADKIGKSEEFILELSFETDGETFLKHFKVKSGILNIITFKHDIAAGTRLSIGMRDTIEVPVKNFWLGFPLKPNKKDFDYKDIPIEDYVAHQEEVLSEM